MREIKFRAILPNIDKQLSMSEKPFVTIYFKLENLIKPIFSPIEFVGRQVILKNWICDGNVPDQYIGREDRSGKEIYEADLIAYYSHGYNLDENKGEVEWGDDRFSYGVWENEEFFKYIENMACIEILGNIHENPELRATREDKE